ncbi:MAG TPA: caspase family protein [Thermoanaerobaculia bacterium]|nr:caspase family protein [Thermoanaerobaculia bacterium]
MPQDVRVQQGFDASHSAGLFIGIRHFDDQVFTEVPYAVDDAVDLAYLFTVELRLIAPRKVVLSLAGAPQKSISRDRLKALRDAGATVRPATHSEILALLDKQKRESRPQGIFVVAFATHGFSNEGNDFLLASDSLRHRLMSTGIAVGKVFENVGQAQAPRRLLLLDACREKLSSSRALNDKHGAMSPSLADAIAGASGLVVLSSTTLGGYSYDDLRRGNGVFTGAVLDGLHGQAPSDERSFITVRLLADFVDRQVAQWIRHNRPERAEISQGISVRLEAVAVAEMPLAVAFPGQARLDVPQTSAALASDEIDLTGEWKGIYHLYPYASGMTLTIQRSYENNNRRLDGRLQLYPLEIPKRGASQITGSYEVTVEYVPSNQSLVVQFGHWLGPSPQATRAPNMVAVYSRSDDTIAGIWEKWRTDSCPFFALKRPEKAAALVQPALEGMHTSHTWYTGWAREVPSKQRVDEWADRFVEEYPGRIPNQVEIGSLYTDARKLFKDSQFSRYFGKPFDQLGRAERAAIWKKLREPSSQNGGGLGRNHFAGQGFWSTGTFGLVDITISVLAMRSIESWYAEMRYRLENLEPNPSALRIIDAIESQVKRLPQAFWPSEIAAIESRAMQIRSEISSAARSVQPH